jgi:hypothetical protein
MSVKMLESGSIDMRDALKNSFAPFVNDGELRSAIESICSEFGGVAHLKILPASLDTPPQCLCFLRLNSLAAESQLLRKLQLMRLGGDIYFTAEVSEKWSGPRV